MKKRCYLFYGCGSEYVLHDLFLYMKNKGFFCFEWDTFVSDFELSEIIKWVRGRDLVLISSAHLLLDAKNFQSFYSSKNTIYSPLELISMLNPSKSIYIPHDLTQPLITHEEKFISNFDLFLCPLEEQLIYSDIVNTAYVGWIKYTSDHIKVNNPKNLVKKIWLFSDIQYHYDYGIEKTFKKIYPLLKQGLSIKFPVWFSTDKFEAYFRARGVDVIPAKINSQEIINNANLIVTNGYSSVVSESYLAGKQVINIIDSYYDTSYIGDYFADFSEINYFSIDKIKTIDIHSLPDRVDNTCKLKIFDLDLITKQFISI